MSLLLFYNTREPHCREILALFSAFPTLTRQIHCICCDTMPSPNVALLPGGTLFHIPPEIQSLPALVDISKEYSVQFGQDVVDYIQQTQRNSDYASPSSVYPHMSSSSQAQQVSRLAHQSGSSSSPPLGYSPLMGSLSNAPPSFADASYTSYADPQSMFMMPTRTGSPQFAPDMSAYGAAGGGNSGGSQSAEMRVQNDTQEKMNRLKNAREMEAKHFASTVQPYM